MLEQFEVGGIPYSTKHNGVLLMEVIYGIISHITILSPKL